MYRCIDRSWLKNISPWSPVVRADGSSSPQPKHDQATNMAVSWPKGRRNGNLASVLPWQLPVVLMRVEKCNVMPGPQMQNTWNRSDVTPCPSSTWATSLIQACISCNGIYREKYGISFKYNIWSCAFIHSMQHPLHKEHKTQSDIFLQVLHQFFMLDLCTVLHYCFPPTKEFYQTEQHVYLKVTYLHIHKNKTNYWVAPTVMTLWAWSLMWTLFWCACPLKSIAGSLMSTLWWDFSMMSILSDQYALLSELKRQGNVIVFN